MICEEIREELVAYQDGELTEEDHKQVALHLSTCPACTQEAASLARIGQMFASLERVTPSPDFAADFWRRLEHDCQPRRESRFAQWWCEVHESIANWFLTPALVGVASVLIFFAAFSQKPERPLPTSKPDSLVTQKPETPAKPTMVEKPTVPAELIEKSDLFIDYLMIAELDRFARFEEIAAVDLSKEQPIEVTEADIPKEVLDDPGFFAHYPILQQMERLKNLDAVLASPSQNEAEPQG